MKKQWMIYVGNRELQMMAYLNKQKRRIPVEHFRVLMEDGCIKHGRLESEEQFIQTVKEFLSTVPFKIKKAELLLSSDLVFTKRIEVPKTATRRQILYAVNMEFPISASETESILEYRELGQNGTLKKEIMAASLERDVVERYEYVFRQMNIALTGISVPQDRVIHGLAKILKDTEHTILVCVVDEDNALFFVLHQGRWYMQSGFHLTKDERETGDVKKICEMLCAGKQFCAVQTDLKAVERIILIGLNESERIQMKQEEDNMGIPVQYFRSVRYVRKHMEEMPMLFLSMMDAGRDHIDFLKANHKKRVCTIEKPVPVIPGIREGMVLLICCFMLFAAIRIVNEKSRKELLELRTVSEQEETRKRYYAELEREKQMERLSEGMEELWVVKQRMDEQEPDGSLLEDIEKIPCVDSQFDYQYSKKDRTLIFSCVTDDYRNIPDYVEQLENLPVFHEVLYRGYESMQGGKEYHFDVSCCMREGSEE